MSAHNPLDDLPKVTPESEARRLLRLRLDKHAPELLAMVKRLVELCEHQDEALKNEFGDAGWKPPEAIEEAQKLIAKVEDK